MKIYTKKGDQGQTCLVDGQKVSKAHERLEAYGTLDELNAHLGLCVSLLADTDNEISKNDVVLWTKWIIQIQNNLFTLGSHWATEKSLDYLPVFKEESVLKLESAIDELEETLPALTNFILPGSTKLASQLHISRTVARRAERAALSVSNKLPGLSYINRLSDFLFVIARAANASAGQADIIWSKD